MDLLKNLAPLIPTLVSSGLSGYVANALSGVKQLEKPVRLLWAGVGLGLVALALVVYLQQTGFNPLVAGLAVAAGVASVVVLGLAYNEVRKVSDQFPTESNTLIASLVLAVAGVGAVASSLWFTGPDVGQQQAESISEQLARLASTMRKEQASAEVTSGSEGTESQ